MAGRGWISSLGKETRCRSGAQADGKDNLSHLPNRFSSTARTEQCPGQSAQRI